MLIVSLLGCLGCWLFEWMVPARFQRFQHCKASPKLPVLYRQTPPVPSPAPKHSRDGRAWTEARNDNVCDASIDIEEPNR